jgi:3-oxoacyl-[acyl-carrier-protein] synthase III
MEPILVEPDPKKGYIITHKCTKCGAEKRCRAAHEARIQPDDIDLIIKLTAGKDRY